MSHPFTEQQLMELKSLLRRSRKNPSAAARVLAVLSNPKIVRDWEDDPAAVRAYLLKYRADDAALLKVVGDRDEFARLGKKAREHRERLADPRERRMAVAFGLAGLVADIVDAGGVGLGTAARRVLAVAGMEIARAALKSEVGSSRVVSILRLSNSMVMRDVNVGNALREVVASGALREGFLRHTSGASRYSLRKGSDAEMARYSSVVNSLLEYLGAEPLTFSEMVGNPLKITGKRWRERQARLVKAAKDALGPTTPNGLMTGLDERMAGKVAADLIVSAASPVWSAGPHGRRVNGDLWLAMLRGTLGIKHEAFKPSTRMLPELRKLGADTNGPNAYLEAVFGKGTIDRLNAGERMSEMLNGLVTGSLDLAVERRAARWTARSAEIRADAYQWVERKSVAEKQLTAWLEVAPAPPWPSSSHDERAAFVQQMKELIAPMEMGVLTSAFYGSRFERRLTEDRGWDRLAAGLAAREVFAGMPRMKTQARGVVVHRPVEVGGVLV